MEIGDCVLCLEGHDAPISDMAVSADGMLLITTSVDSTARVWELEKGECVGILAGMLLASPPASTNLERPLHPWQ